MADLKPKGVGDRWDAALYYDSAKAQAAAAATPPPSGAPQHPSATPSANPGQPPVASSVKPA